MTSYDEEFVHYVGWIEDLNRAWSVLQELRPVTKPTAVHAARWLSRSFSMLNHAPESDGAHKHGRQGYALPEPEFSADDLELHRRMLNLRRQVLTHSDLTLKEASVYVGPD